MSRWGTINVEIKCGEVLLFIDIFSDDDKWAQ